MDGIKRTIQSPIVFAGIGFGLGMALGTLLIYAIFSSQVLNSLFDAILGFQLILRILIGLLLTILIFGLGGALGGGIGGWTISSLHPALDRRRLVWRGAISFFTAQAILVIPVLLAAAVVSFLNQDLSNDLTKLPRFFGFFGFLYGLLGGLLLGALTVGLRKTLRIALASTLGFWAGGMIFGLLLRWVNPLDLANQLFIVLSLILASFFFGAIGGGAIGFAFEHVEGQAPLFPQTRGWRTFRNITISVLLLVLLVGGLNFLGKFIIKQPDLSEMLVLPTQGTRWVPAATAGNPTLAAVMDGAVVPDVTCADSKVIIAHQNGRSDTIPYPPCTNQPGIAVDGQGHVHVIWHAEVAQKATGTETAGHFIYSSILSDDNQWSEPAIIARTAGVTEPHAETLADGSLRLRWSDQNGDNMARMTPYNCDEASLTPIGEAIFGAVRQEKFRPASDPVPYCQNRYDRLLFTPNPIVANEEYPGEPLGAFDTVADLVSTAEYEVLFTTMQWDGPSNTYSPGRALAEAIADLYQKLAENPDDYPRGLTVRILLGNYPELSVYSFTNQIDFVLEDLNKAGLPTMIDEELGWHLELANYAGAWPHAHSKFLVVDGKTAVAAGFNYSYLHLSRDHPSGKGLDMSDKGIQITGPVAQAVLAAYDDLWSGADLYHCPLSPPPISVLKFLSCDIAKSTTEHVPEVLRFFVPEEGHSNAFALHHTLVYLESDEALIAAIEAAEESIDLFEVNFSLDTTCVALAFLEEPCQDARLIPPYQQALLAAVAENDVKIRAIVEPSAMNGIENRMAIRWWAEELEKIGKVDNLEIRFADNKMHDKAFVIDKQLLSVGSQNFHWSAWDFPSLTEYNIVSEDPEAIADFYREFEAEWEVGNPVEEQENSPPAET